MKTLDVKQGSPEWVKARLGLVTASEADALVSPEGKVRTGAGPLSYLYRKLTEKILGFQLNDFSSLDMSNGSIIEMEAIPWFEFEHEMKVERVGFCTDDAGRYGFSPDGLLGDDGGLEIKCPSPAVALQYYIENVVPKDYILQLQFSLYVSKRKWWKFLSYSRQWPPLLLHVEPDEKIQTAIDRALGIFLEKFDAVYERIKAIRDAERERGNIAYQEVIKTELARQGREESMRT